MHKKQKILFLLVLCLLTPIAAPAAWQTPAEAMQFAVVAAPATVAPSMPIAHPRFYQITEADITGEVARQLTAQGFSAGISASLNPGTPPVIYSANHPLKVALQNLRVDTSAKLWQADAYFIADGATETVKPVAGRYDMTLQVPVLTRQLRQGDIIERSDIELRAMPERRLRKDSITSLDVLLGKSPTRIISAGRPIRAGELSKPTVVKKGQLVEMFYTTPYMSIRATGEALEDGAQGALIRVKNTKSEKAVSARVVDSGRVELNSRTL